MKDLSKVYPEKTYGVPVSLENQKLRALIFNITSATDCPSKKLELCRVCSDCYATRDEKTYGTPLHFHNRQTMYFDAHNSTYISRHLMAMLVRYDLDAIRYQEAGDFRHQDDVDKLTDIARLIPKKQATYTSRVDLDFSQLKKYVNIRLSGYPEQAKAQGVPYTRVVDLGYHGKDKSKKRQAWVAAAKQIKNNGNHEILCPGNCKRCQACWNTDYNIVFPLH